MIGGAGMVPVGGDFPPETETPGGETGVRRMQPIRPLVSR